MGLILVLVVAAGSVAAHGEAPTVVLPVTPVDGTWPAVSIPLTELGIDPSEVTVSGALRGTVRDDSGEILYIPDRFTFPETDFDLLRVEAPGAPTVLNVAVVRAESRYPKELAAQAGDTAVADPGWAVGGSAVWDTASGTYLVTGPGEIRFDFMRDDVADQVVEPSLKGAQSGSGSSIILRPPPPHSGLSGMESVLVYQGGGGDDVWELWLHPGDGRYLLEAVLSHAAGTPSRLTVSAPDAPEFGIDLSDIAGQVELYLEAGPGPGVIYPLDRPSGFQLDRTWHRFGNLSAGDKSTLEAGHTLELDDLRVARRSLDLARQVVVVDDFDAKGWSEVWTSPAAGALHLGTAGIAEPMKPAGDRMLIASLEAAREVGPDYLERKLEVPRVAMTCRFELDLSRLASSWDGTGGEAVVAFRDESLEDPEERDYARLLVRRQGVWPEVRLVGRGKGEESGTPWIPLAAGAAPLEMQWQRTSAEESRLDLWIDGCGPSLQPCTAGWRVTGVEQPGLVTAVRFGIFGAAPTARGEVAFDDVACAGDSWIEAE